MFRMHPTHDMTRRLSEVVSLELIFEDDTPTEPYPFEDDEKEKCSSYKECDESSLGRCE